MRRIQRTGVGGELGKKLRVPVINRFQTNLATVSGQYSDGTATAEFPVGAYTYQLFQLGVKSNAAIGGDTITKNGEHFVNTAALSKYIEEVTLVIDGVAERKIPIDLLVKLNASKGLNTSDGFAYMTFGGPHEFWDKRAEDAYMLGTGNLRSMRLDFKLKPAWADGSMFLHIGAEVARIARPLEFISTMKSRRVALGAAGEHTITDLPINADIARIYVFGTGLKKIEFEVDDEKVFDAHSYAIEGLNSLYGTDVTQLDDGVVFNFWRSGEVEKGLKSLESAAQRKRNADIQLMLETINANTEVQIVMELAGRYVTQA